MPAHVRSTDPPAALSRLPALDGMRALAVLAVLFYHADMAWMPGGFLGVECFFVLSGFLITTLLRDEWQRANGIDLGRFWRRRAQRLLPALLVLLVAVAAFVLRFAPEEAAELRGDTVAALVYATNWWLIVREQSYFAALDRPSLLQHLWSLAVEMQFYLVWPPLFVVLMRRAKRWGTFAAVVLGALASSVLAALLFQPDTDPSRIYYGSDTRVAGMLIGAALALVYTPAERNHHQYALRRALAPANDRMLALAADLLGIVTIIELAIVMIRLDEFDSRLYQGGFAAVALLTAILIFAATHPAARLLPALLSWQPLRWLGTRSYSIYLWHWPIFMFTRPQLDLPLGAATLLALRIGMALACAELSYRLVERPIHRGALGEWWRTARTVRGWRRVAVATPAVALLIALGGTTAWLGGALAQANAQAPDAEIALATEAAAPSPTAAAALARREIPTPVPATATPPAPDANIALQAQAPTARIEPAAQPPTRVLAIGDSVMVGASRELRKTLGTIEIDAKVSRQAKAAQAIVQARRDAGQLGDAVVLHIGTNGPFSRERFTAMMDALKNTPRVVVVNVKVPRRWEQPNNTMLAEAAAQFPNVRFVDWYAASANRPEFFRRDGIHLNPPGIQRYVELIARALVEP